MNKEDNNFLFKTPEEELRYLRSQVSEKIATSANVSDRFKVEDHASKVINNYSLKPTEKTLHEDFHLRDKEKTKLIEGLNEKDTDQALQSIIMQTMDKGIKNMIDVVESLKKPQIEDDFHRFLIQYILSGREDGINKLSKREYLAVNLKLFEVILPFEGNDKIQLREYISNMERLYTGLMSIGHGNNSEKNYYSLELAIANGSNEVSFYLAINRHVSDVFEKLIVGLFPEARVSICKEDYNIFHDNGAQVYAYAKAAKFQALPIKTYDNFESDNISSLISSFTKIKKDGEGASVQILVRPAGDKYLKEFSKVINDLRKGETLKRIEARQSIFGELTQTIGDILDTKYDKDGNKIEKANENKFEDEQASNLITKKLESTILETNIRLIVNAETIERASAILSEIEATYIQYTESYGNSFKWERVKGRQLYDKLHAYTYREFDDDELYVMSLRELATIYHYPLYVKDLNQLRSAQSAQTQAPLDLIEEGTLIGINNYRSTTKKIYIPREDRMRHLYVIGQTGTGKTGILSNMIVQDIEDGYGCCFIDPHGTDILNIMANIPENRWDDVIYFDPSYIDRPMALNMLEYDMARPEQKTFVVNELLSIFKKLFADSSPESMGPAFEQYFRNTALLVMEHPESGNTLIDLTRVLSDKDYRDYKLSKCKNPLIKQFWKNAEATTGEQGLENYVPYISNKFDVFLSNDVMRPIIAQQKSSFNFKEIMDGKKIFLVNLSKGRLGDINAHLIGLILVGKFLQAALSRVDSVERPDFYLYIDEFQNVTTPSISAILSEARKYRLSLNVAHQYIGQLPEDIKNAVFGNVGSKAVFRVGPDDAKYLEAEFEPAFKAGDIMRLDNRNAYVKMLSQNTPQKPFNIRTMDYKKGDHSIVKPLQEASYMKYGRDRAEVEAEIMKRWDY